MEQFEHWQPGRCLAVRYRVGFQQFTFGRQHCLEFVKQPRFAGAGLGHHRDDLPLTALRQVERALHLRKLRFAPDEPRQPAPRRQLKVASQGTCANHPSASTGASSPLYRRRPQCPELEVPLARSLRHLTPRSNPPAPRTHPRREICHVPDRRVFRMASRLDRTPFALLPAPTPTPASTGILPSLRKRSA